MCTWVRFCTHARIKDNSCTRPTLCQNLIMASTHKSIIWSSLGSPCPGPTSCDGGAPPMRNATNLRTPRHATPATRHATAKRDDSSALDCKNAFGQPVDTRCRPLHHEPHQSHLPARIVLTRCQGKGPLLDLKARPAA